MLVYFQVCISVPLNKKNKTRTDICVEKHTVTIISAEKIFIW